MPITHDPNIQHEWAVYGRTMVTRTKSGEIPKDLWTPFMTALQTTEVNKLLALVVGAASINATQRAEVAKAFKEKDLQVAVVTNDRVVRGVITALSWLGARVKPFAWSDADRAVDSLELPEGHGTSLKAVAARAERELEK